MANKALVVGCDDYPGVGGGTLSGAVRDALAFRDWVLDPQGGQVAPADLVLLASPSASGAMVGPGTLPATRRAFDHAVHDLLAGDGAERLYVYFAGHGCGTDIGNAVLTQDVLVFNDFDPISPATSCASVGELRLKLALGEFEEIVVLVDACRDFPFTQPFRPAGIGFDPPVRTGRTRTPRTFVLTATVVGGTAHGSATSDGVRGDFTRALLAGLTGDGAAKQFDDTVDARTPYRVTWWQLANYVTAQLPQQRPAMFGEGDLVLASFADGWFDDVRLDISVDGAAAAALTVEVLDLASSDNPVLQRPGPSPVSVTVPPRRHRVTASAGGFVAVGSPQVYVDTALALTLAPRVRPDPTPVTQGEPPLRVTRGEAPRGSVALTTPPGAAVLVRVTGPGGRLMADLIGTDELELPAGSYSALAFAAGTPPALHAVEIEPGRRRVLDVGAFLGPAGAALELYRRADDPGPLLLDAGLTHAGTVGDRATVAADGFAFTVPLLDDAVTVVAADDTEGVTVRLFDRSVSSSGLAAYEDLAQALVSTGQVGAARVVLARILMAGPAARALLDGSSPAREGAVQPSDVHRLIGRGPWAVLQEVS